MAMVGEDSCSLGQNHHGRLKPVKPRNVSTSTAPAADPTNRLQGRKSLSNEIVPWPLSGRREPKS